MCNNSGAPVNFRKKIIALFQDRDHIREKPTPPQAKVLQGVSIDVVVYPAKSNGHAMH